MSRFDKLTVLEKMRSTGVVPVFYNNDIEIVRKVVMACYAGGIRVFEFTNRGDFAHEVFADLVRFASAECPDMAVGAGSIVDPATAALYMQLGAAFIVGPMFNPEIAKVCNRRRVLYSPGCGTVTEVSVAQEAGCDLCKVFPGEILGPSFVKSLMAPLPWSLVMVTGGVEPTEESIASWMKAGTCCVGMGSKLFPSEKIKSGDWDYITKKCNEALAYVEKSRPL